MRIIPEQVDETSDEPGEVDWSTLIETTGLDPASLQSVEPEWTPWDFADTRAAWEGSWPEQPDLPLRIEAAAYRGRPVALFIREPWELDDADSEQPTGQKIMAVFIGVIFVSLMLGAVLLARRNLRLGRGDRKGAFKMAMFVLAVGAIGWVLDAHHTAHILGELELFFNFYPGVVFLAGLVWLVYIALEPFLRSRWPDASRSGLLSVCALFFIIFSWEAVPSLNFSSWYAGNTIVVLLTLAAVVGYAFYTSLGGRSLFAESMVPGE